MPHTPGHKYIIDGTNQEYFGKVVKVGNDLFTSSGGTLEGNSYMVHEVEGESGAVENNVLNNDTIDTDIVTKFVVGVDYNHPFYHPIYSTQTYYFQNSSVVQMNTPLHHHSKPEGDQTEFMTQHSMTGPDISVSVFTTIPSQLNTLNLQTETNTMDENLTDMVVQENNLPPTQPPTQSDTQLTGGPSNQQQAPPAQTGGGMGGGGSY